MAAQKKVSLYNSDINILGGIPDYTAMIRYVTDSLGASQGSEFSFRTENALKRFVAAIGRNLLTFKSKQHKKVITEALSDSSLRDDQKYIIIFWQMLVNNELFAAITENYFMKCLYAGRLTLSFDEIQSYLFELRRQHPNELQWSDATLKITVSKYLTMLKKLGLAEGSQTKEIHHPIIGDELFVYFVRLALAVYPKKATEDNPLFKYSFLDTTSLVNKLKAIKFTPYWQIEQLGNNIKIELSHE